MSEIQVFGFGLKKKIIFAFCHDCLLLVTKDPKLIMA
jgi:hypothetical protein